MPHSADSSRLHTLPMRWCTFIDILGFSQLWEAEQLNALHALRELMWAIHRISTRVYRDEGERLLVHNPTAALVPGDPLSFNFPVLSRLQAVGRCKT